MKLHLVLLALLQQALCAQEAFDSAELKLALQTKPLDMWIESIATRRNISKDAVRANVQAVKYHLDPLPKDPGSTGGKHAELERRQPPQLPGRDYPEVYMNESRNDVMTNHRLSGLHFLCRQSFPNPPGTPYVPNANYPSFWRAGRGDCIGKQYKIFCKLPNEFGPVGWRQSEQGYFKTKTLNCPPKLKCGEFYAHAFVPAQKVKWGGCILEDETEEIGVVNNIPTYGSTVPCPIHPMQSAEWDGYGETSDGKAMDWRLFTGRFKERISYARAPNFMFNKIVEWRGKDPDYQPWLKFAREGERATVNLYSHLF